MYLPHFSIFEMNGKSRLTNLYYIFKLSNNEYNIVPII